MLNLVKNKEIYPDIFKPLNITSLYKRKGEKSDFDNDRGIFNVVKIRSILDKLVYNDKSSIIDSNMSSSNIGGRKNRNIRDHLFVVNAVLHEVNMTKEILTLRYSMLENGLIKCGRVRMLMTSLMLELMTTLLY